MDNRNFKMMFFAQPAGTLEQDFKPEANNLWIDQKEFLQCMLVACLKYQTEGRPGSEGLTRIDKLNVYCDAARNAANPRQSIIQMITSITAHINQQVGQKAIDLGNSTTLRMYLTDGIFDYFKNHFDKVREKSSKSHWILFEKIKNYYDLDSLNWRGVRDYSCIYPLLDILKQALQTNQTTVLLSLLQMQELAVNAPIRDQLVTSIFEHLRENLDQPENAKSNTHKAFLSTILTYYDNDRSSYFGISKNNEGIYRALNIVKELQPLDEKSLLKALISIQVFYIRASTPGSDQLDDIGTEKDVLAGKQLLKGSYDLRQRLEKLICHLVKLEEPSLEIYQNRAKTDASTAGASAVEIVERAINETTIRVLIGSLRKEIEALGKQQQLAPVEAKRSFNFSS